MRSVPSLFPAAVAMVFTSSSLSYALDTKSFNKIKSEYVNKEELSIITNEDDVESFVFLQKFPLEGSMGYLFHTEVLVCPRNNFSGDDQKMLDDKVTSLTDYVEIEESWWSDKTTNCVELGYGGASCAQECCSVPFGAEQTNFPLNARRAVISNADTATKSLYLYGRGDFDGVKAWHNACDSKCWSKWSGYDYNPITNNCNTFTSTILACVYGLSQKKPHLTVSDMVTVKCDELCKSTSFEDVFEDA
eukprot:CAMPEP_0185741202 /NCGR_PEP_ID=MMETSP1171-20130828/38830_1 /TAXON_ID=374046 /ORGANISM="Helicotheca tamensis, Strain CCMP826" /LENGTH=246 /DNA_ID=CAMNT_0028413157 /DNA_START=41 /DNA_END=781 /DNA_ORIENTATION=-